MGATNTTTHYNLSQFISTDKPAWLQDYNGDMAKIDAGIDAAKVAADTAQNTANTANSAATQAASDISALGTTVTGQGTNITALQLSVNTINSLIGNGLPTTTDQTIIGAINEINAEVQDLKNSSFGSPVDIHTYHGTNYTAPSDGYVIFASDNTTVSLNGVFATTSANGLYVSVFVKEGMAISFNNSNATANFYPLV